MSIQEITIGQVTSSVITYKGARACTTRQLAQFYDCDDSHISDNFRKNPDRFDEGKHFIRLEGEDLRAFKRYPEIIGLVADSTRHLILWLEKGAARHAKMLTTEKAWEVFEELEDRYFCQAPALAGPKLPLASLAYREAASITRDHLKVCKLLGIDDGMAKTITAKQVRIATGLDFTPLLTTVTATHDPRLTVAQLAERMGSGVASGQVNSALEEAGLQIKERWTNQKSQPRSKWVLTEIGKEYGALATYQAEGNEHSGYRPVWYERVIEVIRPFVEIGIALKAAPKPKANRQTHAAASPEPQPALI
jgi:hypothetical protein